MIRAASIRYHSPHRVPRPHADAEIVKITFTKGSGKFDRMCVERGDGTSHVVACPRQRIIPHEMVHYAVESTLHKRGFLSRVKGGEAVDARMQGNPESDGVERLVEVFQGDGWSGGATPIADMLDLYQVTCRERACPALPVDAEDMSAIRSCIEELDRRWQPLRVGESVTLDF
jgi:hypothetical protein